MRKHWLDNLRWFTVVLVLLYHVFYFFNSKGVFGGIGPFDEDPLKQPQDIILYILYPWFMMLLFLLAGISARYAIEKKGTKAFMRSRSLKLLVPATIGLLVFQWITGYFNTRSPEAQAGIAAAPGFVKWLIYALSGTGPLWFIQDLWVFSLILTAFHRLDPNGRFRKWCSKAGTVAIILLGITIFLGSQVMIMNPAAERPQDGLINLYRPVAYFIPFLLGYFVFCNEEVLDRIKGMCIPMSVCATAAGIAFCIVNWGKNCTTPEILTSWLNCLYAWLMILALIGIFMRFFDKTNGLCRYMTRSSYGFYILHYSVMTCFGYLLKTYTTLNPWIIYPLLIIIVFSVTPALYELLRRIPFLRWAILGEKTRKTE